jgi:glycosyltransferase involved in cell wall biosynthesis
VIGSRRGGTPELIEDGVTGLLFDPDEPGALARALGTLVRDPDLARRMRPRCLESALRFEPTRVLAQHLALYDEVAGSGRGGNGAARTASG